MKYIACQAYLFLHLMLLQGCSHKSPENGNAAKPVHEKMDGQSNIPSSDADHLKPILFGRYKGRCLDGKIYRTGEDSVVFMISLADSGKFSGAAVVPILSAYRFILNKEKRISKEWEWSDPSSTGKAGMQYIKHSLNISDWDQNGKAEASFGYTLRLRGMYADTMKMLIAGERISSLKKVLYKEENYTPKDTASMYQDFSNSILRDSAMARFYTF